MAIDTQKFLADLQSDNPDTRFAAWRAAGQAAPAVIPQVGRLAASDNPGVAKAAREALTTMTHAVGKDPKAASRAAVVKGLLDLTAAGSPLPVRVHALRLLSQIAGEDSVAALAKLLTAPEVAEEAIYAIERIPGPVADKALMAAYPQAKDDFKPRILAALGHRKTAAAGSLAAEAMASSNPDIGLAGVKAFGRIGQTTDPMPRPLDETKLTPWGVTEQWDAGFRFAEAQARAGNTTQAMTIYKLALTRPESHLVCAAVLGLAKVGTADASALILPLLKSENRTIRITAQNAWKSFTGSTPR